MGEPTIQSLAEELENLRRNLSDLKTAVAARTQDVNLLTEQFNTFTRPQIEALWAHGYDYEKVIMREDSQVIINPGAAAQWGVKVELGDQALDVQGELNVRSITSTDILEITTPQLHVHASELILDGRNTATDARALVDTGDTLILNCGNDFKNGVEVQSGMAIREGLTIGGGLRVDGALQANDVQAFRIRMLYADPNDFTAYRTGVVADSNYNQLVFNYGGGFERVSIPGFTELDDVHLNGSLDVAGTIRAQQGDVAEQFELAGDVDGEPGTVMVVGATGALEPCRTPHDARVAGVISGAGSLRPALVLNERQGGNRGAIALIGTVYCKVEADSAPISAGDLLTTSRIPGHAMKAADPSKCIGAIIGKALQPLAGGSKLIPILVAPR